MPATSAITLVMPEAVDDAVAALAEFGPDGAPLAGGTWIMRAPIRGEARRSAYVGLGRIAALQAVDLDDDEIRIGAGVTHVGLVAALSDVPQCRGLVTAAAKAANPAVRQMATIGGNLAAWEFPASDLTPALLSLEAAVELRSPGGTERVSLERFLLRRRAVEPGILVSRVVIPRRPLTTGHARLPLRKAGDYPVAIVSAAASMDGHGKVDDIRLAVGSVEASARRWPGLERALLGARLDPASAQELARERSGDFAGRDSVEAPAWYRVQVLPALVRRAVEAVLASPR
ncbi:xanthine dehydrogenase family protein subunit M [Mesorhizobium sp. ZMM04-5]|uniref:Xanthine dehydrogenase family protein subunit M n=1 Tax=Mesorhizobium marinum TaxID=3228790 RepID=A0ABV3R2V8_9HYPH